MMLAHALALTIIAVCGLLAGLGIVRIVAWTHHRAIERERAQLRMWHAIATQAERGR
ncbi:hypothetical protein [Pseudoxanthomonas mexicana]|uniref:hypothetical protein n=1 Tax=Pseudoxanthomonas mexicana TaxID=128785 RepID=UPI00398AA0B5